MCLADRTTTPARRFLRFYCAPQGQAVDQDPHYASLSMKRGPTSRADSSGDISDHKLRDLGVVEGMEQHSTLYGVLREG